VIWVIDYNKLKVTNITINTAIKITLIIFVCIFLFKLDFGELTQTTQSTYALNDRHNLQSNFLITTEEIKNSLKIPSLLRSKNYEFRFKDPTFYTKEIKIEAFLNDRMEFEQKLKLDGDYLKFEKIGLWQIKICKDKICDDLQSFLVFPEKPTQLNSDGNLYQENKINLIFNRGNGFDTEIEWKNQLIKALCLDGKPQKKDDNLEFGFFCIEPIKSSKSLFQIFYEPEPFIALPEIEYLDILKQIYSKSGFKNMSFAYISNQSTDVATFPSFLNKQEISSLESENFGNLSLKTNLNANIDGLVLAHELSHALFGLQDEYLRSPSKINFGYPNCAKNLDQAESWWGKDLKKVDPFYYDWRRQMQLAGTWEKHQLSANNLQVDFVLGGCGADLGETKVLRPTQVSVMNDVSRIPVFGSVNRNRVEQILNSLNK
jgi:hypothetical protein